MSDKGGELYYEMRLGDKTSTEPALMVGGSTATVAGLISLVMYLTPDLLTAKQITIISIVIAFAAPIVSALFTRGKVWTPASVQVVVAEAVKRAQDEMRRNQEASIRRNQIGTPYPPFNPVPPPLIPPEDQETLDREAERFEDKGL